METYGEIDRITHRMMEFDAGSPERIQHFLKVHRLAQLIGRAEHLEEHTQWILECAALVHDIGIGPCEKKYGRCTGKLQETEGPAYASALLAEFSLPAEDIQRICYLVAHHHTYTQIDGMDYQILVEADFLVNLYERGTGRDGIQQTLRHLFKTAAGISLCQTMFGLDPSPENTENDRRTNG